jgi:hypothetical protein
MVETIPDVNTRAVASPFHTMAVTYAAGMGGAVQIRSTIAIRGLEL